MQLTTQLAMADRCTCYVFQQTAVMSQLQPWCSLMSNQLLA